MKKGVLLFFSSCGLLLITAAFVVEGPKVTTTFDGVVVQEQYEFIGATRCRMCHRTEEQGQQYDKWLEGPHSKAYAALASDEAKKIAEEKGIGNPQEADECLKCHVTGHGVAAEFLGSKYSIEEGVSCESCHGAGGEYNKKSTMEGITAGDIEPSSVGLVIPTEETCKGCHNEESPTFKGFDFAEASAKIAHPKP